MADTKISAAADAGTLVATDKLPLARSGSATAYAATAAEIAAYANGTYAPSYAVTTPLMDGVGAGGSATTVSRGDHRHPTDATLYPASNPAGYRTAVDVTTSLAPYAPLASPPLTGTPTAPTVTPAGDSTTKLATTAFVQSALGAAGAGVSSWNARAGAVTLTSADVTAVGGATAASVAAAVAPALNNVGRNLLHNAMFRVNQRGAGPWSSNAYTADRWVLSSALDSDTLSLLAGTDTVRAQIGDEEVDTFLSNAFTGNGGAAAFSFIAQRIENVRRLAGKTVTVSFWANASSLSLKLGVSLDQSFGTGGSPSADVFGTGQAVTLASVPFTRYSLTFTVPSGAGKTLGTNGDSYTALNVWYSSGSTNASRSGIGVQSGSINLWGVQLEIGSVTTPLERLDPQQDLAKCQRFYQVGNFGFSFYGAAGSNPFLRWALPVLMRAPPAVTSNFTTQTNCGASAFIATGPDSVQPSTTVTALGSFSLTGTFTASADL